MDSDTFRSVLGRFATGVTILTARDASGADHGMTVSAFCSLSLEPPLVLFCIDRTASMYGLLTGDPAPACGISILSSDQEAYSRRFADETEQRFGGIPYSRGERGVVLLDDALIDAVKTHYPVSWQALLHGKCFQGIHLLPC